MSIGIQEPPPSDRFGGAGPTGRDPYAGDVLRLATAIRNAGSVREFTARAEALALEFDGSFAQSIVLHIDSRDSRAVISGLQLLQLGFDTAVVLYRSREVSGPLEIDFVEQILEDRREQLILTGSQLGSWLGDFTASVKDRLTQEEVFSLVALVASTISVVAAVTTADPVLLVTGAVLTELDALNRFNSAANDPAIAISPKKLASAPTTINIQAGPTRTYRLTLDGRSGSRAAFTRYLKRDAEWLPINRKKVTSRSTGVNSRAIVTIESHGGLTAEQLDEIVRLANSMNLLASWI